MFAVQAGAIIIQFIPFVGFLEESELRRESSSVPQVLSSAAGDRTDGKRREVCNKRRLPADSSGGGGEGWGLYQIFGVIARKLSLFSFYWGLDLYEIMRAGREAGPHRPLVTLELELQTNLREE